MKRMFVLLLSALGFQLSAFPQGALTPPGPPGPTFKTLEQIEPRTPITNLPVTISQPGSYYFVTNLTGTAGQNGITISANDVTIDLKGFALVGVPGSGSGITVPATQRNLAVRNGVLRGWGSSGINGDLASNSQFESLRVSQNQVDGIRAGDNSLLLGCNSQTNGGFGIVTARGCTVVNCIAAANPQDGFNVGDKSTVRGCAATSNTGVGFQGGSGSVVKDCLAAGNGDIGISVDVASTVAGCTVEGNGSTGIFTSNGSTIEGCTARSNGSYGISAGEGSTVSDCTAAENNSGGIFVDRGTAVNNCTVWLNKADGIQGSDEMSVINCTITRNSLHGMEVGGFSVVRNNSCELNGFGAGFGAGIRSAGNSSRIEGNHVTGNDAGILLLSANNLVVRNSARLNPATGSAGSSNYVFTGTQTFGPTNNLVDATTGTITNAHPWANFSY